MRKAMADKILILGIDGMDPRITKKFLAEGKMPYIQKYLAIGAAREDLVMLGGQPTVTPPMWTTLATGANPSTHGITCYFRQSEEDLDVIEYNFDSTKCKAEPLWNVFAEAGKKTLVWHWPGSAWPPTSDSENLYVVDGSQPAGVNCGIAVVDPEKLLIANVLTEDLVYRSKAASDGNVPCTVADLEVDKGPVSNKLDRVLSKSTKSIMLNEEDFDSLSETPFDIVLSPIKPASGWTNAPADAKEFVLLYAGGLRRPCLILKNDHGIYDRVAIYKGKKESEPIVVLENNVFIRDIVDEALKNDQRVLANRNMRILNLAENGESLKIWISAGMDFSNDAMWHPKSLHKTVIKNVGYPQPLCTTGGSDKQLISDCMKVNWDATAEWTAASIKYLIETEKFDVVFSHFHNIDLQSHMFAQYMKKGGKLLPEEYQQMMEDTYIQTDNYLGEYIDLLDQGWTILIMSDHGIVCPEHDPPAIAKASGLHVPIMRELGFTEVLQDNDGKLLHEIDWEKTKAVSVRGNHIYLNIKGRNKHGIVDPADQFELEEEIMTALYGLKDPQTGKRVIAMALRNKDALLLGMGGPECGDILYWTAEGYNGDHCDSLSTTYGFGSTSVSPIFLAAGKGIKEGFVTDRVIREVDFAPTVAVLGGVRMPRQCEGAPVYQIFTEEF